MADPLNWRDMTDAQFSQGCQQAKIERLNGQLAECYRLSGADPDGNKDWRLAPRAVTEVKRLREESDAEIERLQRDLETAQAALTKAGKDKSDSEEQIATLQRENAELRGYREQTRIHYVHTLAKLAAAEAALDTATEFMFAKDTFIRKAIQRDGGTKWKVSRNGEVLATDGEWEYEPLPSSRDDEFLARTRYETFNAAIDAAKSVEPDYCETDETAEFLRREGAAKTWVKP